MAKVITAAQAAALISDNATVACSGHGAMNVAEDIFIAMEERYINEQHPKNLTMFKGVALGDFKGRGMSRLSKHEGLISTVISAHTALEPDTVEAVKNNKMMCYMLPLGTVQQILRSQVGKKPGLLTNVGLKTFADPRFGGGKGNDLTREKGKDIVHLMTTPDGKEALYYPYFPIDFCLVRASYADTEGNISLEDEALITQDFEIVGATRNAGGTVIVVVNEIVEVGHIHPKNVAMHSSMVDYVVKASPENRSQSLEFNYMRPELAGHYNVPLEVVDQKLPLNERKICGRRAAMEVAKGAMLNLGIGIPEAVGAVLREEGLDNDITISIETGIFGGVPLIGTSFGAVANAKAIMRADDILQWYDGGGLDMTCLGAAEIDKKGNVNASSFNGRSVGPGGFVDISQNTPHACFVGTFTAGGLKVEGKDGKLVILNEGKIKKLKEEVEQITFSADYAVETNQNVLYITERAVFKAAPEGLTLIEIAPGVDLQKDVLDQMEFKPVISPDLKLMDERIFRDEKMGLVLLPEIKKGV